MPSQEINETSNSNTQTESTHINTSSLMTIKDIKTMAGASTSVWVFCLVLSNLLPDDTINYLVLRWIAASLSIGLGVFITYKSRIHNLEKWIIGIVNGLLIFINASGLNTMTSSTSFMKKKEINSSEKASLFPNIKQVNWWPDKGLLNKLDSLENLNKNLNDSLKNCQTLKTWEKLYSKKSINIMSDTYLINNKPYKLNLHSLGFPKSFFNSNKLEGTHLRADFDFFSIDDNTTKANYYGFSDMDSVKINNYITSEFSSDNLEKLIITINIVKKDSITVTIGDKTKSYALPKDIEFESQYE